MDKISKFLQALQPFTSLEKALKEAEKLNKDTKDIKEIIKRRNNVLAKIKKMKRKIIQHSEKIRFEPNKIDVSVYIRVSAPFDNPLSPSEQDELKKAGATMASKSEVFIDSFYLK